MTVSALELDHMLLVTHFSAPGDLRVVRAALSTVRMPIPESAARLIGYGFETLLSVDGKSEPIKRYVTEVEARQGHEKIADVIRSALANPFLDDVWRRVQSGWGAVDARGEMEDDG